jgi:hypothetical protein
MMVCMSKADDIYTRTHTARRGIRKSQAREMNGVWHTRTLMRPSANGMKTSKAWLTCQSKLTKREPNSDDGEVND